MKSAITTALSVLLFVSIVTAQNQPPVLAGSPHDTMRMGKNSPDRYSGPVSPCPHGNRLFPGHGINFRPDMLQQGCDGKESAEMGNANCCRQGPHYMHRQPCCFFLLPLVCKLLFLGFILYSVLNILLTIIVSLDMAHNGRFNGLWIPILLIAGIPGAVIYSLFRIGDKLLCKGT
jgi:hypothetical protein